MSAVDKNDPPRAYGVFKPVGHTLIAFHDEATLRGAVDRLVASGVDSATLTTYTSEEMLAQTADDLQNAGPLATIGQELNLVKAHNEMAKNGGHFLVMETDKDEQAELATQVAKEFDARLAQRYGRFTVEELIDPDNETRQVFESPDRGLDDKEATSNRS